MIGGSLALALRRADPALQIRLWGRDAGRSRAAAAAVGGDVVACKAPDAAVADAGLAVFCTPVETMPALAREVRSALDPTAVATDAGSVKGRLVLELEAVLGARFVGAHPMAGSEKTGFASARADLYDGSVCILTPTAHTDPAAMELARVFWARAGCRVVDCDPFDHDRAIAKISHLPHLSASALVEVAAASGGNFQEFAGPGYRDSTRVAMGAGDMWAGILHANRDAVIGAVDEFIGRLGELRGLLAAGDRGAVAVRLQHAADLRSRIALRPPE